MNKMKTGMMALAVLAAVQVVLVMVTHSGGGAGC